MRRILTILAFIICAVTSHAQQHYKPSLHAGPQNKPSGISSATPLDSRSYFYDTLTFSYRPYANRAEVLSYLYLATYRRGQFTIIIDSISHKWAYWFRDSTRDQDLVLQYNFAAAATDSSVFATLYRLDTAKTNLRTEIAGKVSTTLPTGQILAGNLSNVATPVTPGGVLTMTSGGSFDYVTNSVLLSKIQQIPSHTVIGNPTGSTATPRSTYLKYGFIFDNDSAKIDTTTLKNVFGAGTAGWGLTGNSGTIEGTNFIGTIDNIPLSFRVNNLASGYIGNISTLNTFFGNGSGSSITDGQGNTLMGYQAGITMQGATDNVGVGVFSLVNNRAGNFNTAIGVGTMAAMDSGYGNTAIGISALTQSSDTKFNTVVGSFAGYKLTGNYNILLTNDSTSNSPFTTASGNTVIGGNLTTLSPTLTNSVVIGNGKGTERLRFDGSGNYKATPQASVSDTTTYKAKVVDASGNEKVMSFWPGGGGGSGITSLTTDVVATGPGAAVATIQPLAVTTGKINTNAVTNAKMATSTANQLAGYDNSGNFSTVTVGSGLSEAGGVLSATGVPESIVGTLFNRTGTFSALSFATTNGSGQTNSVTGGNIKMISDASSPAGRSLDIDSLIGRSGNGRTDMEHWLMKVGCIAQAKTSLKKLSIGLRSYISGLTNNLIAELDLSNGGSSGKITLYDQVHNLLQTSTTALSFSAGDSITLSIERRADKVYCVAQDVTTKSNELTMTPFTFNFTVAGSAIDVPNGGKFAIFNSSDTAVVYSVYVFSIETKNPSAMCITDSKGYLYAGNYNNTWPAQLTPIYGSVVRNGGSSETAGDAYLRKEEIIAIAPRTVLLSVGRNGGLGDTTNYKLLVTALQSVGINVIHTIEGYDATWAASGAATFISMINSNYAANTIIDGYTPIFYCPDCIATDNVHLTTLGSTVFANTITQANLVARGTYTNPLYGSGNVNDLALWSTQQNGVTSDGNLSYTNSGGLVVLNKGTFQKDQNAATLLSVTNSTNGASAQAGVLIQSDNFVTEPFQYSTTHTATNVLCAGCGGIYSNAPALVLVNDKANGKISFAAGSGSVPSEQMQLNSSGQLLLNTATNHSKILTVNGGIWQNKDSLVTSSAGSVMSLGIDTTTGNYVKFTGGGGGGVTSVFGRTGAVVAATNDYSFSQISGSVADGQLSSNVPLKNAANTFTAGQTISTAGGVTAGLNINSSNAASYSSVTLTNAGSFTGQLFLTGGSYTPAGILSANGLGFYSNGAGGIDIWADNNGPILFSAKATTGDEGMRLNTNNEFQIGSSTDLGSSKLQVTGTIQMQDGNQGAGKVLTSDANGVGTWQTVGAGGSDTLRLVNEGTGLNLGFTSVDTLKLSTILAVNSISGTKDTDSTLRLKLVNDTAIGAASAYYYGTGTGGSAGRLGYYQGPVSGTYTPTLTNQSNVASSSSAVCHYLRVANQVTVTGVIHVTATTGGASTAIGISYPFASTTGTTTDCSGISSNSIATANPGTIAADVTNNRANLIFLSSGTSQADLFFTFMYTVQ